MAIRKDHRLITTGPYSIVRHPAYAGVLLTVVGIVCWHAGSVRSTAAFRENTIQCAFLGLVGTRMWTFKDKGRARGYRLICWFDVAHHDRFDVTDVSGR